jgi:hypothetical protein
MDFFCYIVGTELISLLFYLIQYYYQSGWLTRFSFSITSLIGFIIILIAASFFGGWVFAHPDHKIGKIVGNWITNKKHQQVLLISFSFLVLITLWTGIIDEKFLANANFGLIPIKNILVAFFVFFIQADIKLLCLYFSKAGLILGKLGALLEKYGVYLIFFLFSFLKIWLLTPIVHNYMLYSDTHVYAQMARQIHDGYLSIVSLNHYPPLYPFALQPIFFFSPRHIYDNLIIINVLLSTSAIFPIYLLTRQFLNKRKSLLFAVASACYPSQIFYSALFMSENLAYPLFFWAFYFCFSSPKEKKFTILWDVLAGIAIGLSWLTRYVTISLLPIFLVILWIKPDNISGLMGFAPTKKKFSRLLLIGGIALIVFMLWVIPGLFQGVDIKTLFGFYVESVGSKTSISLSDILFWSGISLSYFIVMVNPVLHQVFGSIKLPFMPGIATMRKWNTPSTFWVVSLSMITLMFMYVVTQHAWKASYNLDGPQNYIARYIIYLPVLFWLTGIMCVQNQKSSSARIVISGIISLLVFLFCYSYLLNLNWLGAKFLYNGSIDFFTPNSYSSLYFLFLIVFVIASSIVLIRNKPSAVIYITMLFLTLINIGSWPNYLKFLEERNIYGRELDEVIVSVLDNPRYKYLLAHKDKLEISTAWYAESFIEELDLRGIDPGQMKIVESKFEMVSLPGCKPEFLVQYGKEEAYLLVKSPRNCKIKPADTISQYSFDGEDYKLIKYQNVILNKLN